MKKIAKWFNAKFPSNQWEMDPNHKVEWTTDYGKDEFANSLSKSFESFGSRLNLFARTLEVWDISAGMYIRKKLRFLGLKTNDDYLAKMQQLLEAEVEAYLLDSDVNKELKEEYARVRFLGEHNYNPNYDHAAYLEKAEKNSITRQQ